MKIEGFSWVSNGSPDTFLFIMGGLGAVLALVILGLTASQLTPKQRRLTRLMRAPGATVVCDCQPDHRIKHPAIYGTLDGAKVTTNALRTEWAITDLQNLGCPRILVTGAAGTRTVGAPNPITEYQRG